MLELYHSINSICAQKVRMALQEKGLEPKQHLMTLVGANNGEATTWIPGRDVSRSLFWL